MPKSSLSELIAGLEAKRAHLDAAIASLRAIHGDGIESLRTSEQKPKRTPPGRPHRSPKEATPATADQEAAARKALARGPLTPKAFTAATGLGRRIATQLIDAGVIVATGATLNRRYALPGKPAKEAP